VQKKKKKHLQPRQKNHNFGGKQQEICDRNRKPASLTTLQNKIKLKRKNVNKQLICKQTQEKKKPETETNKIFALTAGWC